jgi:hypothetical protein
MDEHQSAQSILRRALVHGTREGIATVAAAVDPAELEEALAHVASCEECSHSFDVADTTAWLESREATHAMAQVPVDPAALFESALTVALSDPEDLVRRRAAQRLGEMTRLRAAGVDALVAAAGEDRDERVRAAALTALQRFDTHVSLPQWVIDVWSAAPAEAAPYLAGVLARLAAPTGAAPTNAVTRLDGAEVQDDETVVLSGERGVQGHVSRESDGLWLTVEGLPADVEDTKPVVAIPRALEEETGVAWAGDEPGLVAAAEPVSGGSLRVRLGDVEEGGTQEAVAGASAEGVAPEPATQHPAPPEAAAQPAAPPKLFDQIYLLHPKHRDKQI